MCSGSAKIAQSDEALQTAQAAMTNTLNQDYSTTFAENQKLLGTLQARLNYIASNPIGYTPEELHAASTSIIGNAATSAKQALGSAAAYAAAHGGADVGSGVAGEIAGNIGVSAANEKAAALADLATKNAEMKRQNMWTALSGLGSIGSQLTGSGATALSGAGSAAESSVSSGTGALNANQAAWQDIGAIFSGIGGLGMAGASAFNDVKTAH